MAKKNASKQEYVGSEWIEDAKREAAIEKALKIEKWVKVYIVAYPPDKYGVENEIVLHKYDLPREMWLKYDWVITWRRSKCQCQHPRMNVTTVLCFYDKKSGLELGYNSLMSKLVSAKANITKWTNKMERYIAQNASDMFFDPKDDPLAMKMKATIASYKGKVVEIEEEIKAKLAENAKNEAKTP